MGLPGKIWFYMIDAFLNVAAVLIGAIIIAYYLQLLIGRKSG